MRTLKVAVVSSKSKHLDIAANLRHFETLIERAAGKGSRLVCFPELALTSYTKDPAIQDVAEKIPGPSTTALVRLARKHKVTISMGMAECAGSRRYIAQCLVGPEGYIGKYRKHFLAHGEGDAGFSPGKRIPVFDIDGVRVGISICFDGRHPELFEGFRKKRVDCILHPHGNVLGLGRDAEQWTRGKMAYLPGNAIRARAYVIANNSAGDTKHPNGTTRYGSGAIVIDPLGQVVKRTTRSTRSEKMIICDIVRPLSVHMTEFELKHEGLI